MLHSLLFSSLIIHPLYRPLLVFILSPMLHSLLFSSLLFSYHPSPLPPSLSLHFVSNAPSSSLLFSSLLIHPLYRPLLVSPPSFILSPMLHSLLFSSHPSPLPPSLSLHSVSNAPSSSLLLSSIPFIVLS